MRVLAIDTALEACAAAVLDTKTGAVTRESLPMVRGHAEALMPLIERVMRKADARFATLDRIAVTTGPGSFTGLRVGISAPVPTMRTRSPGAALIASAMLASRGATSTRPPGPNTWR